MIEEEVFKRKRFVQSEMEKFGFRKVGEQYLYETDFMNGNFKAILSVSLNGELIGKVIDKMNDEEYMQLRSASFNGAYVNSVRSEYRKLLEDISKKVCKDVLFESEQANRITDLILSQFNVKPDFPWEQKQYQSYGTFRHADSKKWFALIMNIKRDTFFKNDDQKTIDIINLKSDNSEQAEKEFSLSIFPGYHMNHKTWISIVLDDSMNDETVMSFVKNSFKLT